MIITYRNPGDKNDTIDVHFDIEKNYFTDKWIVELKTYYNKIIIWKKITVLWVLPVHQEM